MHPSIMPKLTITFAAPCPEPHLSIICNPPFVDVNIIYRAVVNSRVRPYRLAIESDMLSEETAVRIYAQAYAEGVVSHCDEPPYDRYGAAEWERFFLANPYHFKELREHLDYRKNWPHLPKEGEDGQQLQRPG